MKRFTGKKMWGWTHIRDTALRAGLFSLLFLASSGAFGEERALCALAQDALREASRLRGLAARQEVPCEVQERSQVESFIRDLIAKKYPPRKLAQEGELYRAVGLIPESFDYENGLIAAYVGQIGGYYDPERKRFIIVNSIPERLARGVSVHELTHALQDQFYDLDAFLDPAMESGDELLARAAVAEGDANLVMQAALRSRKSDGEGPSMEISAEEGKGIQEMPSSLRRLLLFPYDQGLRFVDAVQRNGGFKAREALFQKPPRSTREVIHPEDFIVGRFVPHIPTLTEVLHPEKGDGRLYSDTIGEFGIATILTSKTSESGREQGGAQGWRGDRAVLLPNEGAGSRVVWLSVWDTPQDANEFASAYRRVFSSEQGTLQLTIQEARVRLVITRASDRKPGDLPSSPQLKP